VPHRPVPQKLYARRAKVEQLIEKLKLFKRIAMRRENTKLNFALVLATAFAIFPARSVHMAWSHKTSIAE
jgi:hypothetical protein